MSFSDVSDALAAAALLSLISLPQPRSFARRRHHESSQTWDSFVRVALLTRLLTDALFLAQKAKIIEVMVENTPRLFAKPYPLHDDHTN